MAWATTALVLFAILGLSNASQQTIDINLARFSMSDAFETAQAALETASQAHQHAQEQISNAQANMQQGWNDFKQSQGKAYGNSTDDEAHYAAFQHALSVIAQHNQIPGRAAWMGLGPFADMNKTEFIATKMGLNTSELRPADWNTSTTNTSTSSGSGSGSGSISPMSTTTTVTVIPDAVNWVAANRVVPIKDQGQCGDCWVFAATSAIETASAIKTGDLYSLSEEQILDCGSSRSPNGNGCNGGGISWGFEYVENNGGQTAESGYPYTGSSTTCNTQAADWKVVQIEGHEWVNPQDENALMAAVSQGSVVVAIASRSDVIQYYGGGIVNNFADCCTTSDCQGDISHAVVVVGYNKTEGYWLLRNSWGTGWGENGYFRLAMGTTSSYPSGMCGLLSYPIRPLKYTDNTVSGTPPPGATLVNLASGTPTPAAATTTQFSMVTSVMTMLGACLLAMLL